MSVSGFCVLPHAPRFCATFYSRKQAVETASGSSCASGLRVERWTPVCKLSGQSVTAAGVESRSHCPGGPWVGVWIEQLTWALKM